MELRWSAALHVDDVSLTIYVYICYVHIHTYIIYIYNIPSMTVNLVRQRVFRKNVFDGKSTCFSFLRVVASVWDSR